MDEVITDEVVSDEVIAIKHRSRIRISLVFSIAFVILVILMAVFPSILSFGKNPLEVAPIDKLELPGQKYLLGADEYGRDLYTRIVYGARNTVSVGLGSALLAVVIGVPLGLIAGFFGGVVDMAIMRVLDAFLAFPMFLLAILVMSIFPAGPLSLIGTIGVINFPRFARIVRGNVLSLKEREFVEANRAFGARKLYTMFRTILPNCASAIIVQFTLLVATAITIEAGMSFLGLGIAPPAPAWGSMLSFSQTYISKAPLYAIAPGAMIFLIVMSINMIGDALRDYFDPVKQD